MTSFVSRKYVLEHLLSLPAQEAAALVFSEPGTWGSWLSMTGTPKTSPGIAGAQRFVQRSQWVLQASAKHENARARLRRRLNPWLVAVFDLACEPSVKVVAPVCTMREILRQNKDLCVRLSHPGEVTSLRRPQKSIS